MIVKVTYKPRTNACKISAHDLVFCLSHLKGPSKSHISLSRVKIEVLVGLMVRVVTSLQVVAPHPPEPNLSLNSVLC